MYNHISQECPKNTPFSRTRVNLHRAHAHTVTNRAWSRAYQAVFVLQQAKNDSLNTPEQYVGILLVDGGDPHMP